MLSIIALVAIIFASCKKENINEFDATIALKNLPVLSQNSSHSFNLMAGQTILAGEVKLDFDNNFLYVEYIGTNGWMFNEVQLWVGANVADIPKNKSGNPTIGLFPYKANNLGGVTSYKFTIDLNDFGGYDNICGQNYYIAAHAAMFNDLGNGQIQTETGWSFGPKITNKGSWAMYSGFVFDCSFTQGPGTGSGCETAYAYGSQTFINAGLTNSRWGWIYTINAPGTYTTPLYAGAAQNDISKGTHVGNVTMIYDGSSLVVNYDMFTGFTLSETHLYASSTMPTTIANGLLGNTHSNLNNATSDSYSLQVSGNTIYVIAHAVACN